REIVYLQCSFWGENSLRTYEKNERVAVEELINQFHRQSIPIHLSDEDIREYSRTGNFFKADTLMLLKYNKYWRILSVDLSVFSLASPADAVDLTSVEKIRRMLATELRYVRSKSVFANLSIDTDTETATPEILSGQLQHYFTAFKREDKETAKLIQAASYAHNFYTFLIKQGILTASDPVLFNVVGYTDRNVNAMTVRKEHIQLLATCADIYKAPSAGDDIANARDHVLETIQKAAAKSFTQGRKFVKELVQLVDQSDGMHWLDYTETLDSFINTKAPLAPEHVSPDIRKLLLPAEYVDKNILDIHAALTRRELSLPTPYLFLTGHPGIGKTTAIVNFLKARAQEGQGFLFLYVSPRKQVNLDIIKKFRQDTGLPPCENLFALTANSVIIRNNHAKPTVHYYSNQRQDTFYEQGVKFIHAEGEEAQQQKTSQRHLEEIQEGLLIDKGERISGVLDSLCRAIHATLDKPLANAIVATVAIQSLKRTKQGNNTLRHLEKILLGATSKQGGVIVEQMQRISQTIQYFFVMIDEVTGDESGAEFLHGIHTFLHQYELFSSHYGINTKIIVADASIVDPKIIQQHLSETTYEPNKIYFRRVPAQHTCLPLSYEQFNFKRDQAAVINANAYPASKVHVTYKIGVDALQYNEDTYSERSKQLRNALQQRIVTDILAVLDQQTAPQILVYIQDKQRLAQLIQAISKLRNDAFEANRDYLEIHANVSEQDKKDIEKYQDQVKVVFMTASASRGLSFKRAKHILVDIPHFEIEQNLMEILQVIYRGRGGDFDQDEKALTFYLADRVVYSRSTDRDLSVRESMLHLLNVLLILKTSIMTRIEGSGMIGLNQRFMMIPIGGKSVFAAGETFTSRISKLIKELSDLSHRRWEDKRLEHVYVSLTRILSNARIRLISTSTRRKGDVHEMVKQSYIPLIPTFSDDFAEAARKGLHNLLLRYPLEQGYLSGGLLIVPIVEQAMQEHYWMEIEDIFEQKETGRDLLTNMYALSRDPRNPDSVHMVMRDAIAFIELLKKMASEKIPHYEQESAHTDQHYALPFVAFLAHDTLQAYFKRKPADEDQLDASFRSLLASYIRALYPADSLLPIGRNYDAFPFIIFRSLNLGEARRKMFTDKYLFMSHEVNILNMLLSGKEEETDPPPA
ncbi:MAG TPA: helicase-related protein, partial [Ktedonobacteraceae bacterium]|nr:helicase-related protein [Ktedonobacteraceae bacterium]